MSELKNCPFCGGEAEKYQLNYGTADHVIRCSNIDCGVKPFIKKSNFDKIVKYWNTRTPTQITKEDVEKMARALSSFYGWEPDSEYEGRPAYMNCFEEAKAAIEALGMEVV